MIEQMGKFIKIGVHEITIKMLEAIRFYWKRLCDKYADEEL